MGALCSGGRLARRDEGAWPKRPVTEEQRRQAPARTQPSGLPIFAAAAALLVSRIFIKDILLPCALRHRQISGNASVLHFDIGSRPKTEAAGINRLSKHDLGEMKESFIALNVDACEVSCRAGAIKCSRHCS